MQNQRRKLFISTAIDYVNAPPHLGHALEKIQADVLARYHRMLGRDVFFLTGTDENSLKNVQAAEKEGVPVKEFVDNTAGKFYQLKKALNLSFDDFIRTTEERHIKGSQKFWRACQKDIYKKKYKGLYCVGCEEFYKESELKDGCCPEHKKEPELVEEENFFFRLSKYQEPLKDIIERDKVKIFPEARKNEVLSFINSGLQDICISRSNERARGWGIDAPGDPSQKMWCWIEALANYITALGYGENSKKFRQWWQENENKLHIIGKGISRFHAVYWLGLLLSAGLSLPEKIFVHGYITIDGKKMSKSLGNVVDPFELTGKYGADAVRYFLLREIPSMEDGDFTYEKFEQRYNADLANGIGNLLSRTLTMAEKYWQGKIPAIDKSRTGTEVVSAYISPGTGMRFNFRGAIEDAPGAPSFYELQSVFLEGFQFDKALASVNNLVGRCDIYIDAYKLYKPSEVLEDDKKKVNIALYDVLETIRHIAWLLLPFMPDTTDKIFKQLGLDPKREKDKAFEEAKQWGGLEPGTKIKKGKPLFPRLET